MFAAEHLLIFDGHAKLAPNFERDLIFKQSLPGSLPSQKVQIDAQQVSLKAEAEPNG